MKIFNFTEARVKQSKYKIDWLESNYKKPISQKEFIEAMQVLKTWRRGSSKAYSPSSLKQDYKNLVTKFGFFPKEYLK